MPRTRYPFDPPIDAGLWCRHCNDPIVATAQISDGGLSIKGLREYEWTHAHGSDVCKPRTVAQPFDAWVATGKVEAVESARVTAEDSLRDDQRVGAAGGEQA